MIALSYELFKIDVEELVVADGAIEVWEKLSPICTEGVGLIAPTEFFD